MNVSIDEVETRIHSQIRDLSDNRKAIKDLNKKLLFSLIPQLKDSIFVTSGNNISCIVESVGEVDSQDLILELVDTLNETMHDAVIIIGAIVNDKPYFVCSVSPNLIGKGDPFHAARLVKEVAAGVNGGGGGKPEMATAGGRDKDLLEDAMLIGRNKLLNI